MRAMCMMLLLVACHRAPEPRVEPQGPSVELRLDDRTLAHVVVTGPVPLTALVPTTPSWYGLEAISSDGRFLELSSPATTYPGAEIRLDLERGAIILGVFPRPATGVPASVAALSAQPVVTLSEVTSIDVWTRERQVTAAPPALVIERRDRPLRYVSADELEAIPQIHRGRMRGWVLRDLIASVAAEQPIARIEVHGDDTHRAFTSDQLEADAAVIVLKRNQRGQLVLQVWEQSTERADVQIRGVKKILTE